MVDYWYYNDLTEKLYPGVYPMTNKTNGSKSVDWTKPIETSYYEGAWKAARLVLKDRKCEKGRTGGDYTHMVLYYPDNIPQESCMYFTAEGKSQHSGLRVRNVPEKPKNTKHIILTYRTSSGKLSAAVKPGDFLDTTKGRKFSVGDMYQDNKVLHIAEFELVA
jgi:hypothetical protein